MTKWKDKIDRYIGEEQKFSPEMKEKILRKASKRSINWRYALTAISFCIVVLILVLVGPSQVEPPIQSATNFEQLIEEATVEEFFISSKYSQSNQFFARDSGSYMQVHAFKGDRDAQNMNLLLHDMKLVERPYSYGIDKDVLVVMSNGEQLKLKVAKYDGWFIVQDVRTKLFYKVENTSAVNYSKWDKKVEDTRFSFGELAIMVGAIIGLNYLLKFVLKLPPQKKEKKGRWKGTFIFLATYFPLQFYFHYLRENEYVINKDLHFIVFAIGLLFILPLIDKKESTKNQKISDWIMTGAMLLFIWALVNFG